MNGAPAPAWLKLLLAVAIGAGGAVAATYNQFETQDQHNRDIQMVIDQNNEIIRRLDRLLQEGLPHQRLPQPYSSPDDDPPSHKQAG